MSDEELEGLRATWAELPRGEPLPGCAAPEEIWEAVQGECPEARLSALLQHSITCSDCATLWRLARALDEAARPAVAPLPLRPRRAVWLAAAGALAAAAVLAVALWPGPPRQDSAALRGSEAALLKPTAGEDVLPRAHPVLRWTGAPEGSHYSVSVSTEDLTMLYRTSGLSTAEVELPPAALGGVPAGGTVVWRVEATLPDGRVVKSMAFLSRLE